MKRSHIEKQLKKEANGHTPDVYDKIVLSAKAEGLLRDESEIDEMYNQGNTAVLSMHKKRITGIVALFIAFVACLAAILPILLKSPAIPPVSPDHTVFSANDVYGIGAVSTVKLLGNNTSGQAIQRLASARSAVSLTENTTTDESDVKSQAEKFNEYFTALDSFLGDEIVTTVSETNTDENYPYEMKLTINSRDFNGDAVQNVMYYTETLTDVTENSDADHDEDGGAETEIEREYSLVGILVVDAVEYYMEGERSVEQEEDETENRLKIRAYSDRTDKRSYVEMSQEYSVEDNETETEYVYSIYSDGVLVEQTAVEFETEKDGDAEEIEYELEFRKGDAKGKYVVERETENGKVQMKVKYDIDGKEGEFRIGKSDEDRYSYFFVDGTVYSF